MIPLPRVQQLLGISSFAYPETSDAELWAAIRRTPDFAAPEGDDLDFKQQWYPQNEHGRDKCAGDVAAFANAGGGALVFGVREEDGIAVEFTPFPHPGEVDPWLRQVLASRTFPTIEDVQVRVVPNPAAGSSDAVAVLLVDRSALAPHAVVAPGQRPLLYPIRRGTNNDALTEAALAERYRSRFLLAREQVDRLNGVTETGVGAIDRSAPWLTVTLIPALLGSRRMSSDFVNDRRNLVQEWANKRLAVTSSNFGVVINGRPARRRAELSSDTHSPKSVTFHADFYLDGTGFAALHLDSNRDSDGSFRQEQRVIEQHLVNLLDLVVRHATTCGAGGDAAVQAHIWPSQPKAALFIEGPGTGVPATRPRRLRPN